MKEWCKRIILVIAVAVLPVLAGTNSLDSKIVSGNIKAFKEFQIHRSTENTNNCYPEDSSLNSETESQLEATTDSKEFSSNNPPLTPTTASAILFRDNLQTKPIYWLKAEFNPRDPALHTLADLRFKQNNSPWFMQSNQKVNGRLSGWKDGNSLYTASITYH